MEFNSRLYRILVALTALLLLFGTFFYHAVEKFSYFNAYYFSVVTLATVGYGDLTPHTSLGKFVTTLYIFAGVGIITTFLSYALRRRAAVFQERHAKKTDKKDQ